jgi:hypothetical protein
MLVDVVVLQLPVQHPEHALAAVESCNLVLGEGQCRSHEQAGVAPSWYATIVWQASTDLVARVEVRSAPRAPALSVREVHFSPDDSLEQRYRALGLLVVSHVVALQHARSERPPEVDRPEPAPTVEGEPTRFGLDLMALGGPGLGSGPLRVGAAMRGWLSISGSAIRPQLGLAWGAAGGSPGLEWSTVALGVGAALGDPRAPFSFEIRLDALAQRVQLAAENGERRDTASLLRVGVGAGADGYYAFSPTIAGFVGVQGALLSPRIAVDISGERVGELVAPDGQLDAGVRLTLP